MIVLDTDHLSELQRTGSISGTRLRDRLEATAGDDVVITIITVEEQLRGRLAQVHRRRSAFDEVPSYSLLLSLIDSYAEWSILPFDEPSARQWDLLRKRKIRIGTMDLKIASIVLVRGALLLSANLRDFQKVPGLRVEDWLRDGSET